MVFRTRRDQDGGGLAEWRGERIPGAGPLRMRLAARADFKTIDQMIEDAKNRLQQLGTDQWSTDWPDEIGHRRMDRVQCSIKESKTWIGEFRLLDDSHPARLPVASATIEKNGSPAAWPQAERDAQRPVYLRRLIAKAGIRSAMAFAALLGHR